MDKYNNRGSKRAAFRCLAAVLFMFTLALGSRVAGQTQPQPPSTPSSAAQEGFVPIGQLQPKEQIPAAPLVIAAYVVAWIAVFGYVWSIWQRLGRVEREIADVSRRIESRGHPR
jgi:CcmD family protein